MSGCTVGAPQVHTQEPSYKTGSLIGASGQYWGGVGREVRTFMLLHSCNESHPFRRGKYWVICWLSRPLLAQVFDMEKSVGSIAS